ARGPTSGLGRTRSTGVGPADVTDGIANNADDNTTTCTFTVTVVDTTGPSVTCPGNVGPLQCTGTGGAVATYTTPGATDTCDASPTVSCSPASGSTFALGVTTVTCTARDHGTDGKTGSASGSDTAGRFRVAVV